MADPGFRDSLGQFFIDGGTSRVTVQVQVAKRIEKRSVVRRVSYGCHVGNDEPRAPRGVPVGKMHDGLPSHAVAEQVDPIHVQGIQSVQ